MASVKTWSTKEEVLKDLARASGRRRRRDDLDEGYIVIGNAPPPLMVEEEDDEMNLLFGEAASRKESQIEVSSPDLEGIQQMLQMVKELDGDDDGFIADPINNSDCVIAITKASKLNPNVQEFVPKTATIQSATSINSDRTKNTNTNVVTQTEEKELSSQNVTELNINHSNLNEDLRESEYEDMANKLKCTISNATKSDSFDLKKQKNVAIATLLKLYASKTSTKRTEPIKLITPEYFEAKNADTMNTLSQTPSATTPEPNSPCTAADSSLSSPLQTPKKETVDPEIRISIDKVNKWLEGPEKRKSPSVCLGPVTFKKKDPSSCKSPISSTDKEQKPKVSNKGQYIPSGYATDLGRKYMERKKISEDKKKDVTWDNLDEVLKQKDMDIKKRLEDQTSGSNDEASASSL